MCGGIPIAPGRQHPACHGYQRQVLASISAPNARLCYLARKNPQLVVTDLPCAESRSQDDNPQNQPKLALSPQKTSLETQNKPTHSQIQDPRLLDGGRGDQPTNFKFSSAFGSMICAPSSRAAKIPTSTSSAEFGSGFSELAIADLSLDSERLGLSRASVLLPSTCFTVYPSPTAKYSPGSVPCATISVTPSTPEKLPAIEDDKPVSSEASTVSLSQLWTPDGRKEGKKLAAKYRSNNVNFSSVTGDFGFLERTRMRRINCKLSRQRRVSQSRTSPRLQVVVPGANKRGPRGQLWERTYHLERHATSNSFTAPAPASARIFTSAVEIGPVRPVTTELNEHLATPYAEPPWGPEG
ncbi:hypothetical protein C8R46DRAFT_1039203 [Mycena filopes]|nr:hypothetical protein C8R46DRAFT_1039203 [Mycena filopes]